MIQKMARYSVKEESVGAVTGAIGEFVKSVKERDEGTIMYAAFREGDTSRFTHFMCFTDEAAEERHRKADHTARFVEALYPLCDTGPEFTDLSPVARSGCLAKKE